jgi:FkbM family methyltransferase
MDWKKILNKDNPIILEIGSADGEDSKRFLDIFKDIRLYCFEPDNRGIAKFKKNINDKRCILFETAVGNENGFVKFYQSHGWPSDYKGSGDWDKSSSIKKPKDHLISHPWCSFEILKEVPIIRLDTWIEKNNIDYIDLIWADVQGAEKDLILGGSKTLSRTKFFYTEFSKGEVYEGALNLEQILALLPNFEVVQVLEDDVLLRNKLMK